MKKAFTFLGCLLAVVGLAIWITDLITLWRYGYHVNEVAGFTESGDPIDWPTGEIPLLFQVPIWVYAVGFWVSSAGAFALRAFIRRPYIGRTWRGAE